jgi:hypothetical protein
MSVAEIRNNEHLKGREKRSHSPPNCVKEEGASQVLLLYTLDIGYENIGNLPGQQPDRRGSAERGQS